jgi:hypothetical protein
MKRAYGVAAVVGLALMSSGLFAQGVPKSAPAKISDVAWLAGTWANDGKPVLSEERWTSPAGGAMLAVARTVKGDRMVAFEYLRIVERDGGLVYVAQPGGRPPTFVLTAQAGQSATFENPAHDFPKLIRYTLKPDGVLEATISDGGTRAQTFTFKRVP